MGVPNTWPFSRSRLAAVARDYCLPLVDHLHHLGHPPLQRFSTFEGWFCDLISVLSLQMVDGSRVTCLATLQFSPFLLSTLQFDSQPWAPHCPVVAGSFARPSLLAAGVSPCTVFFLWPCGTGSVALWLKPLAQAAHSAQTLTASFSSGLVAVDLIHLLGARCLLLAGNCLPYHQRVCNKVAWKALGLSGFFICLVFVVGWELSPLPSTRLQ